MSGNKIGDGECKIGSGMGCGGATDVADIANVRAPTLLSIVSVPVKVPTDVGVNTTPAEQLPSGPTGTAQSVAAVRLGSPVTVTWMIISGP